MNIKLAKFDHVFLSDPGLKSTFAENKSCRSFLSLQLLFWPNFKFLYEILIFIGSNRVKNRSKPITVLLLVLHCARTRAHAGDRHTAGDLHATQHRRSSHAANHCSPSPSSSSRARVKLSVSRAVAGVDSGRPSPSHLDSLRPEPHNFTPHLLRSFPEPI